MDSMIDKTMADEITKMIAPEFPFNSSEVHEVVSNYLLECFLHNVVCNYDEIRRRLIVKTINGGIYNG